MIGWYTSKCRINYKKYIKYKALETQKQTQVTPLSGVLEKLNSDNSAIQGIPHLLWTPWIEVRSPTETKGFFL
jgi:hypothetical protein